MFAKFKIYNIWFLTNWLGLVTSHGMVVDPVNRATRWRVDGSNPRNYADNALNCGGFYTQWKVHGGKCGVCGDAFGSPRPRNHEFGGKYGRGTIVRVYNQGATIEVTVKITANHFGFFYFRICNLDDEPESDDCFEKYPLKTGKGQDIYILKSPLTKNFKVKLKLPKKLQCEHCVLQWTYVAGNNWGNCDWGLGKIGCGQQEYFRNCSDIKILPISKRKATKEREKESECVKMRRMRVKIIKKLDGEIMTVEILKNVTKMSDHFAKNKMNQVEATKKYRHDIQR